MKNEIFFASQLGKRVKLTKKSCLIISPKSNDQFQRVVASVKMLNDRKLQH